MTIKDSAKSCRDALQQLIYKIIDPVVHAMIGVGITPNVVTTIGFIGNLAGAALLVYAATLPKGQMYVLLAWTGALMLVSSLFDMMDGQVARIGKMTSTFGAMYDSILDRYSEMTTLGALAFCLMQHGYKAGAVITFLALVGSVMVSYVRARAEGLGLECKIGLMQRPERVVITCLALIVCGLMASTCRRLPFDPMLILIVAMAFIAVFANATAIARIQYSRRQLRSGKAGQPSGDGNTAR